MKKDNEYYNDVDKERSNKNKTKIINNNIQINQYVNYNPENPLTTNKASNISHSFISSLNNNSEIDLINKKKSPTNIKQYFSQLDLFKNKSKENHNKTTLTKIKKKNIESSKSNKYDIDSKVKNDLRSPINFNNINSKSVSESFQSMESGNSSAYLISNVKSNKKNTSMSIDNNSISKIKNINTNNLGMNISEDIFEATNTPIIDRISKNANISSKSNTKIFNFDKSENNQSSTGKSYQINNNTNNLLISTSDKNNISSNLFNLISNNNFNNATQTNKNNKKESTTNISNNINNNNKSTEKKNVSFGVNKNITSNLNRKEAKQTKFKNQKKQSDTNNKMSSNTSIPKSKENKTKTIIQITNTKLKLNQKLNDFLNQSNNLTKSINLSIKKKKTSNLLNNNENYHNQSVFILNKDQSTSNKNLLSVSIPKSKKPSSKLSLYKHNSSNISNSSIKKINKKNEIQHHNIISNIINDEVTSTDSKKNALKNNDLKNNNNTSNIHIIPNDSEVLSPDSNIKDNNNFNRNIKIHANISNINNEKNMITENQEEVSCSQHSGSNNNNDDININDNNNNNSSYYEEQEESENEENEENSQNDDDEDSTEYLELDEDFYDDIDKYNNYNSITEMSLLQKNKKNLYQNNDKRNVYLIEKVYDSFDDELEADNIDKNEIKYFPSFLLNWNSIKVVVLKHIAFISLLYSIILLSWYWAFNPHFNLEFYFHDFWIYFYSSITCDCFLLLDTVVSIFVLRENEAFYDVTLKEVIFRAVDIHFIFDFIMVFPFNTIYCIIGYSSLKEYADKTFLNGLEVNYTNNYYNSLNSNTKFPFLSKSSDDVFSDYSPLSPIYFNATLSLFRMFRILGIFKVKKYVHFLASYYDVIINDYSISLIMLLLYTHISSCIWIYIGETEIISLKNSWITINGMMDGSKFRTYIFSLYFNVVTLFSVGYGDITPATFTEIIYMSFILVISCIVYSIVISSVSSHFTYQEKIIEILTSKYNTFSALQNEYKIPNRLVNRIRKHIDDSCQTLNDNKNDVIQILPYKLKTELIGKMYGYKIKKLKLFHDTPQDFDAFILTLLKPLTLEKNELLKQVGSRFDEIFFILKGNLQFYLRKERTRKYIERNSLYNINRRALNSDVNVVEDKGKNDSDLSIESDDSQEEYVNYLKSKDNKKYSNLTKFFSLKEGENFGEINMLLSETIDYDVYTSIYKETHLLTLSHKDFSLLKSNYPIRVKLQIEKSLHIYHLIEFRKNVCLNNIDISEEHATKIGTMVVEDKKELLTSSNNRFTNLLKKLKEKSLKRKENQEKADNNANIITKKRDNKEEKSNANKSILFTLQNLGKRNNDSYNQILNEYDNKDHKENNNNDFDYLDNKRNTFSKRLDLVFKSMKQTPKEENFNTSNLIKKQKSKRYEFLLKSFKNKGSNNDTSGKNISRLSFLRNTLIDNGVDIKKNIKGSKFFKNIIKSPSKKANNLGISYNKAIENSNNNAPFKIQLKNSIYNNTDKAISHNYDIKEVVSPSITNRSKRSQSICQSFASDNLDNYNNNFNMSINKTDITNNNILTSPDNTRNALLANINTNSSYSKPIFKIDLQGTEDFKLRRFPGELSIVLSNNREEESNIISDNDRSKILNKSKVIQKYSSKFFPFNKKSKTSVVSSIDEFVNNNTPSTKTINNNNYNIAQEHERVVKEIKKDNSHQKSNNEFSVLTSNRSSFSNAKLILIDSENSLKSGNVNKEKKSILKQKNSQSEGTNKLVYNSNSNMLTSQNISGNNVNSNSDSNNDHKEQTKICFKINNITENLSIEDNNILNQKNIHNESSKLTSSLNNSFLNNSLFIKIKNQINKYIDLYYYTTNSNQTKNIYIMNEERFMSKNKLEDKLFLLHQNITNFKSYFEDLVELDNNENEEAFNNDSAVYSLNYSKLKINTNELEKYNSNNFFSNKQASRGSRDTLFGGSGHRNNDFNSTSKTNKPNNSNISNNWEKQYSYNKELHEYEEIEIKENNEDVNKNFNDLINDQENNKGNTDNLKNHTLNSEIILNKNSSSSNINMRRTNTLNPNKAISQESKFSSKITANFISKRSKSRFYSSSKSNFLTNKRISNNQSFNNNINNNNNYNKLNSSQTFHRYNISNVTQLTDKTGNFVSKNSNAMNSQLYSSENYDYFNIKIKQFKYFSEDYNSINNNYLLKHTVSDCCKNTDDYISYNINSNKVNRKKEVKSYTTKKLNSNLKTNVKNNKDSTLLKDINNDYFNNKSKMKTNDEDSLLNKGSKKEGLLKFMSNRSFNTNNINNLNVNNKAKKGFKKLNTLKSLKLPTHKSNKFSTNKNSQLVILSNYPTNNRKNTMKLSHKSQNINNNPVYLDYLNQCNNNLFNNKSIKNDTIGKNENFLTPMRIHNNYNNSNGNMNFPFTKSFSSVIKNTDNLNCSVDKNNINSSNNLSNNIVFPYSKSISGNMLSNSNEKLIRYETNRVNNSPTIKFGELKIDQTNNIIIPSTMSNQKIISKGKINETISNSNKHININKEIKESLSNKDNNLINTNISSNRTSQKPKQFKNNNNSLNYFSNNNNQNIIKESIINKYTSGGFLSKLTNQQTFDSEASNVNNLVMSETNTPNISKLRKFSKINKGTLTDVKKYKRVSQSIDMNSSNNNVVHINKLNLKGLSSLSGSKNVNSNKNINYLNNLSSKRKKKSESPSIQSGKSNFKKNKLGLKQRMSIASKNSMSNILNIGSHNTNFITNAKNLGSIISLNNKGGKKDTNKLLNLIKSKKEQFNPFFDNNDDEENDRVKKRKNTKLVNTLFNQVENSDDEQNNMEEYFKNYLSTKLTTKKYN